VKNKAGYKMYTKKPDVWKHSLGWFVKHLMSLVSVINSPLIIQYLLGLCINWVKADINTCL